jgi:hypothetical protein
MIRRVVLVLVLLFLAGCGSSEGSGTDAGAEAACRHFGNVANDARAGILSNDEFRQKVKEIYDDASVSEDALIRDEARAMLAAATDAAAGESSSAERFGWHAEAFLKSCQRLGMQTGG